MKDYFRPKTWVIAILMYLAAFGLGSVMVYYEFGFKQNIKILHASASDNITGYAWNSNIGWISFNCANDSPACATSNYGVNVNTTSGNFTGYAWSSNVGWISFNRRTCVGGSDNGVFCATNSDCSLNSCRLDGPGAAGAPLTAPYNLPASLEYNAKYNSSTGQIDGWAKILAMGNDGWIKLRKYSSDSGADYGVSIDAVTGNFSGWAWHANNSGGGGIGWVSFNCANDSSCGVSNYKVVANINRPPAATNLTAPNWNYIQASVNALQANLQFDFNDPDAGSAGSAYQLIIKKADDSAVLDTGKCTGYDTPSANPVKCKFDINCLANGSACQYPLAEELNYGAGYKWSVKVWDNHDAASALTDYATNPDTDNNDSVVPTFTTYKHKFPLVSAAKFPANPSRGEEVKFTDTSKTYLSAAPTTALPCDASKCAWLWTVPGGAAIDDAATSTPTVVFNGAGSNSVKLKVTDKIDGYYTEATILVNVNAKLPRWQEVKSE